MPSIRTRLMSVGENTQNYYSRFNSFVNMLRYGASTYDPASSTYAGGNTVQTLDSSTTSVTLPKLLDPTEHQMWKIHIMKGIKPTQIEFDNSDRAVGGILNVRTLDKLSSHTCTSIELSVDATLPLDQQEVFVAIQSDTIVAATGTGNAIWWILERNNVCHWIGDVSTTIGNGELKMGSIAVVANQQYVIDKMTLTLPNEIILPSGLI